MKIKELADMFGLLFPQLIICINFDKKGLGYILGDFFTNSSGHPADKESFKQVNR
jgi:hypothetical protein